MSPGQLAPDQVGTLASLARNGEPWAIDKLLADGRDRAGNLIVPTDKARAPMAAPVASEIDLSPPRVNGAPKSLTINHDIARRLLQIRFGNRRAAIVLATAKGREQFPFIGYSIPASDDPARFDSVLTRADTDKRHCYFAVAELVDEWHAANKKTNPDKAHVAECNFLWGDCDSAPYAGHDPAEAEQHFRDESVRVHQRIIEFLAKSGIPWCALWRSGAGWQFLVRLDSAITPTEAEDLVARLHVALGFDTCVKNANRIIRVAGSINWKTGDKGDDDNCRVPSPCTPLHENPDAVCSVEHARKVLAPFPTSAKAESPRGDGQGPKAGTPKAALTIDGTKVEAHKGWLKSVADLPEDFPHKGKIIVEHKGTLADLNDKLKEANLVEKPYHSKSDVTHALAAVFKADGRFSVEQIAAALRCDLPCNKHVLKNDDPERAVRRAIERSYDPPAKRVASPGDWLDGVNEDSGRPNPWIENVLTAFDGLGITFTRDTFRHKQYIKGRVVGEDFDCEVSDDLTTMLRLAVRRKFNFHPGKDMAYDAITIKCRANSHNPVVEYLDGLKWDGVPRLDNALHTYLGAPSSPYVRAVSRKTFCGMVRRAKQPGCKFDHTLTVDGPQSIGKTMFCRDLAGAADLYTDAAIVAHSPKEAMETMGGKWVIEIGELAGLGTTAREKVKAFLTRQEDRSRMAYDHFAHDQPRSCIFIATKNPGGFLDDPTGERRWWIVPVTKYDRDAFLRDREQLLAEAVSCEPDEKLWLDDPEIEKEHADLSTSSKAPNALVDTLESLKGEVFVMHEHINGSLHAVHEERVSNAAVRRHLGLTDADTVRLHSLGRKLAEAMAHLGWTKAEAPFHCTHKHSRPDRGYRRPWTGDVEELDLQTPDAQTQVPF